MGLILCPGCELGVLPDVPSFVDEAYGVCANCLAVLPCCGIISAT